MSGITRQLFRIARMSAWISASGRLLRGNARPFTRRVRNRVILGWLGRNVFRK